MYRTRGARGDSKLNRTLDESPATASLHSATPKRKNVPCFSDFRGGGFFLKWKGHFSFWGSARKDIRAVWRGDFKLSKIIFNFSQRKQVLKYSVHKS